MLARGMLRGAPLATSSRLLSSLLLVQSLREVVSGKGLHERFPSTLDARPVSTFLCEFSLQPALWQSALMQDHRDGGPAWRAVGVSGLGTDAAPASDVTPEDVLHFW
jgi:hypothetical protein